MDEDKKETHESFGLVSFARVSCSKPVNLFGSSIKHHNTVRLTITRAEKHRNLARDWYYGREELIEVEMSQSQFAEAITSLNMGSGIPCTIQHINCERIEKCPEVNVRQVHSDEFKKRMEEHSADAKQTLAEIEELLESKKNLGKATKQHLYDKVQSLAKFATDSVTFYEQQFQEQTDKTVSEAKGEVEAFVHNRVASAGIKALNDMPIVDVSKSLGVNNE